MTSDADDAPQPPSVRARQATTWVLIPVKAFDAAKGRLSPALEPAERAELAKKMATHVVSSAAPLPVAIVCDDDGVAEWARDVGANVLWCPGTDLNGAVRYGFEQARSAGVDGVVISHSDLPFADGFSRLTPWPGVTIVPDRHGAGTNVLALPTSLDFAFSYGTDSFGRHVAEAARLRKGLRIIHQPGLAWDIDFPADLLALDTDLAQVPN